MRFKKSNCRKKMVFSQPDVSRLKNVAKNQHQANTNIHKTLYKTTVPLQKNPETSHIFKPLLCAA